MYQDIKAIKSVAVRTVIDQYTAEDLNQVVALSKTQVSAFVRTAIENELQRFHDNQSIGRDAKQPDLLSVHKVA